MNGSSNIAVASLSALFVLTPLSANSHAVDCAKTLIKDRGRLDMRESESLAMSELLRRSSAGQPEWAAQAFAHRGRAPGRAGASQAKQMRENYLSETNLDWNQDRVISVATQQLSSSHARAASMVSQWRGMVYISKESAPGGDRDTSRSVSARNGRDSHILAGFIRAPEDKLPVYDATNDVWDCA